MIIGHDLITPGKNFDNKLMKRKFSVFLLWLISKKEQHGYELIQTIKSDKAIPRMAANKIYPILKELHKKGFISQRKMMQGKRARKVYSLTEKGKEILKMTKKHMKDSSLIRQFIEEMIK